jgi:hypothetical protein
VRLSISLSLTFAPFVLTRIFNVLTGNPTRPHTPLWEKPSLTCVPRQTPCPLESGWPTVLICVSVPSRVKRRGPLGHAYSHHLGCFRPPIAIIVYVLALSRHTLLVRVHQHLPPRDGHDVAA